MSPERIDRGKRIAVEQENRSGGRGACRDDYGSLWAERAREGREVLE